MKKDQSNSSSHDARGSRAVFAPCSLAAFALVAASTAWAGGDLRVSPFIAEPNGTGNSSGDSAAGGDDETVGTLPIVLGNPGLDLRRHLAVTRPSLCLQGNLWEVMNAIVAVRGAHEADVTILDARSGFARIVLPGDALVAFDRMAITNGSVQIGMLVPNASAGTPGFTFQLGARQRFYAYPTPLISLPIVELSSMGVLDQVPFHASIGGSSGGTAIDARTTTDVLLVRQSH